MNADPATPTASHPPTRPHGERVERLDRIARRMDRAFRVPGTGIRVGYDSILGLIPGIGDAAAMTPSAYIVLESHRLGAPRTLIMRQIANILIDLGIGSVPLLGDIFDVGFKSNMRNVALLREHLDAANRRGPAPRGHPGADGEGSLSSHHPSIEGRTRKP